jgi:hypothetical protein
MAPQPLDTTRRKANSTKHVAEKNRDLILNDVIQIILHKAGKNARPAPFSMDLSGCCIYLLLGF